VPIDPEIAKKIKKARRRVYFGRLKYSLLIEILVGILLKIKSQRFFVHPNPMQLYSIYYLPLLNLVLKRRFKNKEKIKW